jgi:hypothetical protein
LRHDGSVSILHIEPVMSNCERLGSITGVKTIMKSPREILGAIRGLKTRSIMTVIVCCKLEDILLDTEVINSGENQLHSNSKAQCSKITEQLLAS